MIAGLEALTAGTITIGARDVSALPPKQRDVAMVFQDYALYPQMTVEENLGFGLRMRGVPKNERRRRVEAVAHLLVLDGLLRRKPHQLSGGQQQRVAIGRAVIREPQVYLMDEPLSNLDAKLRVQMRSELARFRDRLRVTTVYVTHDQVEAMTLGERVAVMNNGVIQQIAKPQELFNNPATAFVAGFIGSPAMNLVQAEIREGMARFGGYVVSLAARPELHGQRAAILGIRPTDMAIGVPPTDTRATLRVHVDVTEMLGAEMRLLFTVNAAAFGMDGSPVDIAALEGETVPVLRMAEDTLGHRTNFTACVPSTTDIPADGWLDLSFDTRSLHFFDADSGLVIPRPHRSNAPLAPMGLATTTDRASRDHPTPVNHNENTGR
jgi:multiple sugar transport system ATP-binding protein